MPQPYTGPCDVVAAREGPHPHARVRGQPLKQRWRHSSSVGGGGCVWRITPSEGAVKGIRVEKSAHILADTSALASSVTSALGYDRLSGILAGILADRKLAYRILADRGLCHGWRLPTRQVSGGGNAQHGKG